MAVLEEKHKIDKEGKVIFNYIMKILCTLLPTLSSSLAHLSIYISTFLLTHLPTYLPINLPVCIRPVVSLRSGKLLKPIFFVLFFHLLSSEALGKQRQMYEEKIERMKSEMSPAFRPERTVSLGSFSSGISSSRLSFNDELETLENERSLEKLKEEVVQANALVR